MMRMTALLLALCALLLPLASAVPVRSLSFGDTYDKVGADGKRIVSDDFTYGGSTEVKKNFIRLTPDRQSKRGFIWSSQQINSDQFAAVLTYRIHGQGRRWFGDGIGFWLTHERSHTAGDNHGFTDKYYGVGIVLDTFNNIEHRGGHKDVTVQINDGRKTLDVLNDETKLGCDAAFRYHAGSASFDPVYSSSRIRVSIDGTMLQLDVDARSDGKWESCYKGELPFTREWLRRATIGITASTGSLADNHDIIKLQSFDEAQDSGVAHADSEVWTHNYSKDFDKLLESSTCDQTCKITILQKFIKNFHIESEHWFEELKESTQNTVSKLKEKERENKQKIQALTDRMNSMVDSKIGQRLADVKSKVQEKIATQVEGELVVAGSSWRLPFFFLIVALAGAFGFAYQKYQKLVKNHLL
ncbi:hypothetical protein Poli38472_014528 [Pythium oligandrum]|uniref:L-type lectin-like domain-containing protein n=1 Tax=Pythium oligandrum TaxID=41045 RepID=A0A8K1FIT0_PYTOL|nr:hypothetical protein Poli38472_014528 [Pythium oligandrum]|eukprot:TMW61067.1 hypothetical protein Poli38472_014528 [Pythium oligandrum]